MTRTTLLTCEIPAVWEQACGIWVETQLRLAHHGEDVSSASAMVAAELVENAVKHGEEVPGLPRPIYQLEDGGGEIRMTVISGCRRPERIAVLAGRLRRIREASDHAALYEQRATELLADETQVGGLGLYRVAFEGGFALDHDYRDQRLAVVATRRAGAEGG